MIKDTLQDIVAHTHALGFLPTIKVVGTETSTDLTSIADDKSVVLYATLNNPVPQFIGTFGLPNLDKLNIHLNCSEYQQGAKIEVVQEERKGVVVPTTIHFENAVGDFANEYRFMVSEVINEKVKSVTFNGANWTIEFEPSLASINRMKLQSVAHSQEPIFQVSTKDTDLIFSFVDAASHAGKFVFHTLATEKLKYTWSWPVKSVLQILGLTGTKVMKISDVGAMQITVNSDYAEYKYILPAQSK